MGAANRHLSRSIMHLSNSYQLHRERALKHFGIGRSDFDILFQLKVHGRPMYLGEIAKRSSKDRALIGRSAKHLAELGYIAFQENEFHKTKKDVVLTPAGEPVAEAVRNVTMEWENAIAAALGEQANAELLDALEVAMETTQQLLDSDSEDSE